MVKTHFLKIKHFLRGCSRFFPAKIDVKSAKWSNKSPFLGAPCYTYSYGVIVLKHIVIFDVKLTVSAAKALINKWPAGLLPSFCC